MDAVGEEETVGLSSSSPPLNSPPISPQPSDGGPNSKYIIHTVSKYDTLAGVAIKYGVEVADIKRLNGFSTDLQMFALKTLKIPLRGRHPPSSILCNGHNSVRPNISEPSTSSLRNFDLFDSFQSLKLGPSSYKDSSPAMSSIQGRYGLRQADQRVSADSLEISIYSKGGDLNPDDEQLVKPSSSSSPGITNGFRSNNSSLLDPLLSQGAENTTGSDKWLKKLMRRRQKSDDDLTSSTTEKLLKHEYNSSGSSISSAAGKDFSPSSLNPIPIGLGDALVIDTGNGVPKASSTSSLQDPESGLLSSLWQSSNWNLKPDFQILSASSVTRSIFDGLPKPIGRRNKKALD